MNNKTIEKRIRDLVEEAGKVPNPIIEYSFDLPKIKGVNRNSFFGIKARYNKMVPKSIGGQLIYKLS